MTRPGSGYKLQTQSHKHLAFAPHLRHNPKTHHGDRSPAMAVRLHNNLTEPLLELLEEVRHSLRAVAALDRHIHRVALEDLR